jgi:TolA-binding protein
MSFKYFMITLIICFYMAGCGSEKSLKKEFQQLQSSMAQIAVFKTRCEVLIKDPGQERNKPEACYYLGRLNELFGHYEEAIKHYRYVLIAFSGDVLCPESLYRIGYIYENHIGDRTEAKTAYNQLISFYPDSPLVEQAMMQYAQLACEQQEWQQAFDYFERYIDHFPESRIREDIGFRMADIMQSGIKDTVRAEALYRQLIMNYPQSSWRVFAEEKIEKIQKSEIKSQKSE